MAFEKATMRPFSSYTLEGNWVEDRSRAPPLKGMLADYGFREYATSAKLDFEDPKARKEYRPAASTHRYGMVTQATLSEAAFSYGEGAPPILKFDPYSTSIARAPTVAEEERFPSTSTMREAMARPVELAEKAAAAAARDSRVLSHGPLAQPAGGPGSMRIDRGKRSLGITGEVLRIGQDPKTSTDAQRTWIQRRDPGIHAYRHPPPEPVEAAHLSLPLGRDSGESVVKAAPGAAHGRFAAFQGASRVVTSVTATQKNISSRPGRNIFADE